jgi:hypothetical protein
MPYLLPNQVSFCEVSGRLIFLDLLHDRYFCLRPAAEAAFRNKLPIGSEQQTDEAFRAVDDRPVALLARTVPTATRSVLDQPAIARPGWAEVACACAALLAARASLRRRGLAATVSRMREIMAARSNSIQASTSERIARAFMRADLVLSPLDQCLPRSIALASTLARRGISASLVIGVRLRPFLAHSWVQSGTLLLNDRPDVVCTFVPILVV